MKSIHFCTPKKLKEIKTSSNFVTIRTGWIPGIYPDDTIKINERTDHDELICFARVISVEPIRFEDLGDEHKEEVARYNRKFHLKHWFFLINLTTK